MTAPPAEPANYPQTLYDLARRMRDEAPNTGGVAARASELLKMEPTPPLYVQIFLHSLLATCSGATHQWHLAKGYAAIAHKQALELPERDIDMLLGTANTFVRACRRLGVKEAEEAIQLLNALLALVRDSATPLQFLACVELQQEMATRMFVLGLDSQID